MPTRLIRSSRALPASAAVLVAVLLLVILGFSACGGDDPAAVLDRAFQEPIESADVSAVADARLRSPGQPEQPVSLRLTGPYRKSAPKQLPSLDWRITGSFAGTSQAARLITVPDNAFLEVMGQTYEVGREAVTQATRSQGDQQTLSDFGIKASSWIAEPQDRGDAEVAGEDTSHISGNLDLGRALRDVNRIVREQGAKAVVPGAPPPQEIPEQQIAQIERAVQRPTLDVFVGDDDKIRRTILNLNFTVPAAQQQAGGGLQGGTLRLTTELANVGGDQQITAPRSARPVAELLQQFGLGAGAAPQRGGR